MFLMRSRFVFSNTNKRDNNKKLKIIYFILKSFRIYNMETFILSIQSSTVSFVLY